MRNLFFLLVVCLLAAPIVQAQEPTPPPAPGAPAAPPATLDDILAKPNPWTATVSDLAPALSALRFAWTSAAKDAARSDKKGLKFRDIPVSEVLLRFDAGKLAGATLFFFNRGDSGEIREDELDKMLETATTDLTALTGVPMKERGRDASSAVKAEGRVWETPNTSYLLEWSAQKGSRARMIPFRAEFVRLSLLPPAVAEAAADPRAAMRKFVGRDHVERRPNGDVLIKDVPMVDQGNRGYCVVASVERVMRYYGVAVDQHELAQIGNSQTGGGTSPIEMADAMKKLTARLRVSEKTITPWELNDFLKMIEDYNKATRRGKFAPEVVLGSSAIINVESCYMQMKPEIYREVRLKKTADYGKFTREVQRSIDEGIPLLWSVQLGMVQEKDLPQVNGGHMRLIIGYNLTTKEILYSDSWGAGHEEKRMSMDDAWTLTKMLQVLQPVGA